jgi:tetratricopeptide (TPR) repeat protein
MLTKAGSGTLAPLPSTSSGHSADAVKVDICTRPLRSGFVDIFGDVFAIAFRPPLLIDEIAEKYFSVSDADLSTICDTLIAAAQNRDAGEYAVAYGHVSTVAEYFARNKDYTLALHFFQQGLVIAKSSGDAVLEGTALHNIGGAYEQLGNIENALLYHEHHLSVVRNAANEEAERTARHQLVRGYREMHTVPYLQKALDVARAAGDVELQRQVEHELAVMFAAQGETEAALQLEKSALSAAVEVGDLSGKKDVLRGIAEMESSIERWSEYLSCCETVQDIEGMCEAHERIARMERQSGRIAEYVNHLESNFALSQKTADVKRIDRARLMLGMARAEAGIDRFMYIINHDLDSLLQWKAGKRDVL